MHREEQTRAHDRLLALVFAGWSQGGQEGSWSTLDLSEGGISVKGSPPEPDRPVELKLRMRSEEVRLNARMVWCRESADGRTISGLRFVDTPEDAQQGLDRFLKKLAGLADSPQVRQRQQWEPVSPLQRAEAVDNTYVAALMMLCGATAASLMVVAGVLYLLP